MEKIWPRVSNFCCCIPLKTGALVIGYASVIVSILFFISISWSLRTVVVFVNSHKQMEVQDHTPEEVARVALGLYISHGYFLVVLMYQIAISAVLIVGLHKDIPRYLRVCVYAGMVSQALAFGLMVVSAVFFGLFVSFPVLVWNGLLFYCLIIVRSAYLEMVEESESKDHEMQNLSAPQSLDQHNS